MYGCYRTLLLPEQAAEKWVSRIPREPSVLDREVGGTSVARVLAPGRRDFRKVAIELIVGHEAVGDPGRVPGTPTPRERAAQAPAAVTTCRSHWMCLDVGAGLKAGINAYREQFEAGVKATRSVAAFEEAVEYITGLGPDGRIDYSSLDSLLQPAYSELSLPSRGDPGAVDGDRAGNTREDLRSSAVGFALGEMQFESPDQEYQWIQRNVAEEKAASQE